MDMQIEDAVIIPGCYSQCQHRWHMSQNHHKTFT